MFETEKHTYYHTCEKCGANLDPGESCDCTSYSEVSNENKTYNSRKEQEVNKNESASTNGEYQQTIRNS